MGWCNPPLTRIHFPSFILHTVTLGTESSKIVKVKKEIKKERKKERKRENSYKVAWKNSNSKYVINI
jgi:hypothetical protein